MLNKLALVYLLFVSYSSYAQTKEDSLLIDSLNNEAWSFILKDPQNCLKKAKSTYKLAVNKKYSKGSMKAMITCGSAFHMQGIQDSASYYYNKALRIANQSNDTEAQAAIHNNMGSLYRSKGLYLIALKHLKSALELKRNTNDSCKIASAYINIANLYVAMEEYDQAIELYHNAKHRMPRNDCSSIEGLKIGIGVAHYKLGNIDLALKELEGQYSTTSTPLALNNRGLCYMKKEDFQLALTLFKQALAYNRDSLKSASRSIGNYLNIGKVQTYLGQYDQAENSLNSGLELILKGDFPDEKVDYYENYAELSERRHNWENAYNYTIQAQRISDSLRSTKLDELQSNYYSYFNLQEKERQLKEEKLINRQLQINNENERIKSNRALWIASLLGILVILIVIFSYRLRKRKNQIEEKNTALNNEIEERKYYQERYYESAGRTLTVANKQSKREELNLGDIVYIEKRTGSNLADIHATDRQIYTKSIVMSSVVDNELKDSFFAQVNKSLVINLHYLNYVDQEQNYVGIRIKERNRKKGKLETTVKEFELYKQGDIREQFLAAYESFKRENDQGNG